MKKSIKITIKIIKAILTCFLIVVLLVILVQRFSRNNLSVGGIRIFNIVSESMTPDYQIGDILISKKVSAKNINIGDNVTYIGTDDKVKGLVITHAVIGKRLENGKYYFTTKGIANSLEDPEISEDEVYGKVVYKTIIFSLFGRAMNNVIAYYGLFVVVGVYLSYQLVAGFFLKDDGNEES